MALSMREQLSAFLVGAGRRALLLHQLIWQLLGNEGPVDHENGDGLDCRNRNLRPGPPKLNAANKHKHRTDASSRFKGVSWHKARGRWCARLMVDGRSCSLGYFADEVEAARAYDKAAQLAWGEYAQLNFPHEQAA